MTAPAPLAASLVTPASKAAQPKPVAVPPKQPADPAKMMKAAKDFEAMAIGELLQPMFDTVDTAKGMFGGGDGEQAWKPMLVTEMAKQLEAHGGLGLSQPIYEAMLRMQEGQTTGGSK